MRRFIAGFIIALAIAVPAGAFGAAAKDAVFGTVTAQVVKAQILETDDPNGNATVQSYAGAVQFFYSPGNFVNAGVTVTDPNTPGACHQASTGSLYLEHSSPDTGSAWVKTGSDACAWTDLTP